MCTGEENVLGVLVGIVDGVLLKYGLGVLVGTNDGSSFL